MEYYFFGTSLLLLALVALLALRQIAIVAKAAIEAVKAKNLHELAEVEHERQKNQVDLKAIVHANEVAWKKAKKQQVRPLESPETAEFKSKIVTDMEGRKYHVDELEVL
jgi:hypothetical protein